MKHSIATVLPLALVMISFAATEPAKTVTVKGYVLDSACAKAGSPLVILSSAGTIYWPIADTTPSSSQNDKLLPFAGQTVTVSGKIFQRGGSTAIVISKVEPLSKKK